MIILYLAFLYFVFGAIIGSFLNVLVLRRGTSLSVVTGSSMCFSCGKKLHWYELIPILSFAIQGGKCRGCHAKISWQYPLIETLCGLLFVLTLWQVDFYGSDLLLTISLLFVGLLLAVAVYDFKHKIIPNSWVLTLTLLALAKVLIIIVLTTSTISSFGSLWSVIVNNVWLLLSGPLLALPLFLLWLVSGGRWIGLGDAKLELALGWFLGLVFGVSQLFLAFWLGAIVAIFILILGLKMFHKRFTVKSEIPFAPFLIIAFYLVYFWSFDVSGLNFLINP